MDAVSILQTYLQEVHSLCADEAREASAAFTQQHCRRQEIILQSGSICRDIYFVASGMLRSFHINSNGSEFTRLLVPECSFCTVLLSFTEAVPSPATIQALEDSVVLKISRSTFFSLIEGSKNFAALYTQLLHDFQNFQIRRLEILTQYTPQQRVELFLKDSPELSRRLTNRIIASYLQITPETYSRCLKKFPGLI